MVSYPGGDSVDPSQAPIALSIFMQKVVLVLICCAAVALGVAAVVVAMELVDAFWMDAARATIRPVDASAVVQVELPAGPPDLRDVLHLAAPHLERDLDW